MKKTLENIQDSLFEKFKEFELSNEQMKMVKGGGIPRATLAPSCTVNGARVSGTNTYWDYVTSSGGQVCDWLYSESDNAGQDPDAYIGFQFNC